MPQTEIRVYREVDGSVPLVDWLEQLSRRQKKAYAKCLARIQMLATFGNDLRRPHADYLRDGIYELRAKQGRVNYRILYSFYGYRVAVLSHGMTKEAKVEEADIELAIARMALIRQNIKQRTAEFEV